MIFTIAVLGGPSNTQANLHAFKFVQSAVKTGHHINRVFFFHEGVSIALNQRELNQDEFDFNKAWRELSTEYQVELNVCVASGGRRGVIKNETSSSTLAEGFELVGLGQLVDAISSSDKYIEFAA